MSFLKKDKTRKKSRKIETLSALGGRAFLKNYRTQKKSREIETLNWRVFWRIPKQGKNFAKRLLANFLWRTQTERTMQCNSSNSSENWSIQRWHCFNFTSFSGFCNSISRDFFRVLLIFRKLVNFKSKLTTLQFDEVFSVFCNSSVTRQLKADYFSIWRDFYRVL